MSEQNNFTNILNVFKYTDNRDVLSLYSPQNYNNAQSPNAVFCENKRDLSNEFCIDEHLFNTSHEKMAEPTDDVLQVEHIHTNSEIINPISQTIAISLGENKQTFNDSKKEIEDPKHRQYFYYKENLKCLETDEIEYKNFKLIKMVYNHNKERSRNFPNNTNGKLNGNNFNKNNDNDDLFNNVEINEISIKRTICAFLNNKGGRIYFGIRNDGQVYGILLKFEEQDRVRNYLQDLSKCIFPSIRDKKKVKVYFIPVKYENYFIKNLYVVKLLITQGDQDEIYILSQENLESYTRIDGQNIFLKIPKVLEYSKQRGKLQKNELNLCNMHEDEELPISVPENNLIEFYKVLEILKEKNGQNNTNNYNHNSYPYNNYEKKDYIQKKRLRSLQNYRGPFDNHKEINSNQNFSNNHNKNYLPYNNNSQYTQRNSISKNHGLDNYTNINPGHINYNNFNNFALIKHTDNRIPFNSYSEKDENKSAAFYNAKNTFHHYPQLPLEFNNNLNLNNHFGQSGYKINNQNAAVNNHQNPHNINSYYINNNLSNLNNGLINDASRNHGMCVNHKNNTSNTLSPLKIQTPYKDKQQIQFKDFTLEDKKTNGNNKYSKDFNFVNGDMNSGQIASESSLKNKKPILATIDLTISNLQYPQKLDRKSKYNNIQERGSLNFSKFIKEKTVNGVDLTGEKEEKKTLKSYDAEKNLNPNLKKNKSIAQTKNVNDQKQENSHDFIYRESSRNILKLDNKEKIAKIKKNPKKEDDAASEIDDNNLLIKKIFKNNNCSSSLDIIYTSKEFKKKIHQNKNKYNCLHWKDMHKKNENEEIESIRKEKNKSSCNIKNNPLTIEDNKKIVYNHRIKSPSLEDEKLKGKNHTNNKQYYYNSDSCSEADIFIDLTPELKIENNKLGTKVLSCDDEKEESSFLDIENQQSSGNYDESENEVIFNDTLKYKSSPNITEKRGKKLYSELDELSNNSKVSNINKFSYNKVQQQNRDNHLLSNFANILKFCELKIINLPLNIKERELENFFDKIGLNFEKIYKTDMRRNPEEEKTTYSLFHSNPSDLLSHQNKIENSLFEGIRLETISIY